MIETFYFLMFSDQRFVIIQKLTSIKHNLSFSNERVNEKTKSKLKTLFSKLH